MEQAPFAEMDLITAAVAIRDQGATPPIPNDMPAFLAELLRKCWERNPENRPTMKDIAKIFRQHVEDDE